MSTTLLSSEQISEVKISSDEISEAVSTAFSESGYVMLISLALLIILIAFVFRNRKKRNTKQALSDEIRSYFTREEHRYCGNVCILQNGISYSRGNKSVAFPNVKVTKETYLAPWMVEEWFENRNYNAHEAELIISDIANYLKTANVCKKVTVLTDEQYDELLDTEACVENETAK